jgi:hypothetical protein
MLKIVFSLAAIAIVTWLPIIIFIFIEKFTQPKRKVFQRKAASIPYHRFGKGSQYNFEWYLGRESTVKVKTLRDVCEWLMGCTYIIDHKMFDHSDLWQHPVDFEAKRKGDCEDHSLWAWRKFHDIGIEAEFVVGKIRKKGGGWGDHTWIVIRNGSDAQIMETTAKQMDRFFVGASRAFKIYHPVYGIDTNLSSFIYRQQNIK